jgi:predicted ABC-type transport system involved in lysophospholipase L1 biosynthesis ATPase subunit
VSAVIEARAVARAVGAGPARLDILRGVDLTVLPGEFVAVTGSSGSGKSTLLHLVAGLDRPTAGSIHVCGEDLADLDDDGRTQLRRRRVGLIFQSFRLIDTLTAAENVALPLELAGAPRRVVSLRTDWALDVVGLGQRKSHRPGPLSGGE